MTRRQWHASCFIPRFMFAILGTIHNRDFYSNPMLLTQVCSMDHTLRNSVLVEIWRILYPRDWRRKWQPTPVFLPGESQGQKSLVGCRLGGRTELETTEALSSSSSSIHKRGSPCVCVFFSGEESACDAEDAGDTGSIPELERPPRETPPSVFLPGESHGQYSLSLAGYSP